MFKCLLFQSPPCHIVSVSIGRCLVLSPPPPWVPPPSLETQYSKYIAIAMLRVTKLVSYCTVQRRKKERREEKHKQGTKVSSSLAVELSEEQNRTDTHAVL